MKVVALIPAFNEADFIVQTLTAVSELEHVDEIVVIDDGSDDDTFALASSASVGKDVRVARLQANQGKGAALNYGRHEVQAQVYLLLDADLGATASLAGALLTPILQDEADMTIARFAADQSASKAKMGFGAVRCIAQLGVKWLTGGSITSPLSGQRAVRAEVLQALGDFSSGFGVEVGLTVGALHHGFRLVEVPLAMKHRAYGRGLRGLRHRGRQLFHVLRTFMRCWHRGWHR